MSLVKVKYIKIEGMMGQHQIIMFPETLQHSTFKNLQPISAGFIFLTEDASGEPIYKCNGDSLGLGLKADPVVDSQLATRQILGRLGYVAEGS